MGFSKTGLLLPFSYQSFAVIDQIVRPYIAFLQISPHLRHYNG
jgi:hypothetical protein